MLKDVQGEVDSRQVPLKHGNYFSAYGSGDEGVRAVKLH